MANLQEYRHFLIDELTPARNHRGNNGYQCPICKSGSRGTQDSDGALTYYPDTLKWKCFACGNGGDIYDLYVLRDNLTPSEAAAAVLKRYGSGHSTAAGDFKGAKGEPRRTDQQAEPRKDFREFLARCNAALPGSRGADYLTRRGLTPESWKRFNLGYDVAHDAITIPYPNAPKGYYTARTIEGKRYFKPRAAEAGREPLFNEKKLYSGAEAVFVVEAQLCAISIEQAGGAAVALGGGGETKLLGAIRKRPTAATLIICLDKDPHELEADGVTYKDEKTTQKARELAKELTSLGCFAIVDNRICGYQKDPNDALQADPEGFKAAIHESMEQAESARGTAAAAVLDEYNAQSAAGMLDDFGAYIDDSDTPAIPTGFPGLDKMLDGGLYPGGLYILGAISSLGKTTFALQAVDQIAAAGYDCLVFSLEMSRNELIAKSLSRLTYQQGGRELAKTTRGITVKRRYAYYSDREKAAIFEAMQTYGGSIGARVWITEGMGDVGVTQIREAVGRHISITGRRPVVLIDYLQIMAASDVRMTDKQATDKNVTELKRMARDYKTPVLAISSLNRENYTAPINMAAFKESGAIEYSADTLFGMQYNGMDYQEGETDKARDKRIRELFKANEARARNGEGIPVDLKILKNRNGGRGISAPLTFFPMFNTFTEGVADFDENERNKADSFRNAKRL